MDIARSEHHPSSASAPPAPSLAPSRADAPGARSAPLSDLQYAYLLGELGNFQLGGPALFFEEYACQELDVRAFSAALHQLMARHEMLRASFDEAGLLHVQDELPVPLTYRSLRGQPEQVCRRLLTRNRERCYDEGPPRRAGHAPFEIFVFALDTHIVVQVCARLLAIDGFSGEIFAQELRALLNGESLPPLRYTFREYRNECERRTDGDAHERARRYWLDRLDSLPAAPELPRRRTTSDPSPRLVRRVFKLTPEQWTSLAARIRKNRLTGTMVLGTAFCEVLRHWSKNADFTINIMYGDRLPFHPEVDKLIGNFSSTLLMECRQSPGDTFLDRARAWRRQLLQDMAHSSFGGVSVIRQLNQRTGNARNALMPVVFTSMLGVGEPDSGVFLEHLGWQRLEGRVRTPQVALDHQAFVAGNALVTTWDSADDLYPAGMIDDMFAAYRSLLVRLATEDAAWETESFDLTPAAQLRIREQVNNTAAPARVATMHQLFEEQAERQPDRPAVIAEGREITYAQLCDRANAVAAELVEAGVRPGELVGVQALRGAHQIIALLGVLLAGAAYVPVSPRWPRRRREQVAEICGLRVLLADRSVQGEEPYAGTRTVDIATAIARQDGAAAPAVEVSPDSLAYVIFTSGTSGTPKGVMISHGSVVNTLVDINERFGLSPRDRVLAVSDYTFDLSVWDVFGMLAAGGAVVVPTAGQEREVTHLYELCQATGVSVWNSVPAYLAMFVEFVRTSGRSPLGELRLAMVSGDWVPINLGAELAEIAPHAACASLGGATEASIWSNYHPVPVRVPPHWISIPYGHPLRNQRFQVLDARLRDRPDWVPGELFIGGRGLAVGYLGDEELTAASFLVHPRQQERIYRTGDWARYWPDGTLEFLGREDPQVKVNGFRVELGEIEAALLAHPAVSDAAVVTRTDGRAVSLVAFVASQTPAGELAPQLSEHLTSRLPDYMVPRSIDVRQRLPLTANGKVDRRELAERAAGVGAAPHVGDDAPRTGTERGLATLWQELLEVPEVGRSVGFFAYGGSSLLAARLMNRIEQQFGRRLPLATLYTSGTIAELAAVLDAGCHPEPTRSLVVLSDNGHRPLVLVHPVGGDLLCYRPLLAELGERYRVLGLTAPSPAQPGVTIEELATRYLAELAPELGGEPPDRPLRLAGWSLGGVVAYEMARQLQRQGRRCAVLLIDPWVGCGGHPTVDDASLVRAFLHNLVGTPVEVASDPCAPNAALETLRRTWASPPPQLKELTSWSYAELQAMYGVFEANTRALLRYPIVAAEGVEVDVVEASRGLVGPASGYLSPLRHAAAQLPVRLHMLEADHFTVVDGEHAGAVARLIDGMR
ncbi:amino acid adenylation domain-containing protein [Micromonospora rifamycinica]|uniref:non-ribosomal peptide synthetase n=1 Tax=Micromonospora rifamycinica TaxID=291594 RepID=UPI00342D9B4D